MEITTLRKEAEVRQREATEQAEQHQKKIISLNEQHQQAMQSKDTEITRLRENVEINQRIATEQAEKHKQEISVLEDKWQREINDKSKELEKANLHLSEMSTEIEQLKARLSTSAQIKLSMPECKHLCSFLFHSPQRRLIA